MTVYGHAAFGPGTSGGYGYGGMNTDDIFSQFGDIFGDDMFGISLAVVADGVVVAAGPGASVAATCALN
jgi:hypothetical protein